MNATFDKMHTTLTRAQQERHLRDEFVDGELGWVAHERNVMLTAVNEARAAQALPPVPIAAIERVEGSATGHSDYTRKFAWYCAELVRQEQP